MGDDTKRQYHLTQNENTLKGKREKNNRALMRSITH